VDTNRRVIVVTGEGTEPAVADRCSLAVALRVIRDSAAQALSELARLANDAIPAARGTGVEPADIGTQNVTVQDWYDQQGQRVAGQAATYVLTVANRKLDEVGPLLDALSAAVGDALQVQGITLTVSDTDTPNTAARRRAVDDARSRAAQLAEAAGVRLGALLAIEEGIVAVPRPLGSGPVRLAAAASSMPVEAGSQQVSVRVALTYAIEE
jgi:uncharacterized protein